MYHVCICTCGSPSPNCTYTYSHRTSGGSILRGGGGRAAPGWGGNSERARAHAGRGGRTHTNTHAQGVRKVVVSFFAAAPLLCHAVPCLAAAVLHQLQAAPPVPLEPPAGSGSGPAAVAFDDTLLFQRWVRRPFNPSTLNPEKGRRLRRCSGATQPRLDVYEEGAQVAWMLLHRCIPVSLHVYAIMHACRTSVDASRGLLGGKGCTSSGPLHLAPVCPAANPALAQCTMARPLCMQDVACMRCTP